MFIVFRTDFDAVLYYTGQKHWTTGQEEALAFTGEEASVVCENLHSRGVQAWMTRLVDGRQS